MWAPTNPPTGWTNVQVQCVWRGLSGAQGTNSVVWTNVVTFGITTNVTVVEFSNTTYAVWQPSITTLWQLTFSQPLTNIANFYSGRVCVSSPSVHVPVGNGSIVGSVTETAQ